MDTSSHTQMYNEITDVIRARHPKIAGAYSGLIAYGVIEYIEKKFASQPVAAAAQAAMPMLHLSVALSDADIAALDTFTTELGAYWRAAALQQRQAHAQDGTPSARLKYLLRELAARFPDAHQPFMSDPAEDRFLAAIDKVLAQQAEAAPPA